MMSPTIPHDRSCRYDKLGDLLVFRGYRALADCQLSGLVFSRSGQQALSSCRWSGQVFALMLPLAIGLAFPSALSADALADCRALSTVENDVHACLDNFLDDLDDSMEILEEQVNSTVTDEARALFGRSQAAFADYRRNNCVWYVAFTESRSIAEQLGKNCLIDMSGDRLGELRGLLAASERSRGNLQGYYVRGTDLNTFVACGSGKRYWVESDDAVADTLEQRYRALADTERQLLYVSLQGTVADGPQDFEDHDGRAEVTALSAMRVPLESDCQLPSTTGVSTAVLAAEEDAEGPSAEPDQAGPSAASQSAEAGAEAPDDEPLRAYFGAWEAACSETGDTYGCVLSVNLEGNPSARNQGQMPARLQLIRNADERTTVELQFDEVEIDSPARIRWSVDEDILGDLALSVVRVDESGTRQIVADPDFLRLELLPQLRAGGEVGIDVVERVDDVSGEAYIGSLMGLTRALGFADEFIEGNGS